MIRGRKLNNPKNLVHLPSLATFVFINHQWSINNFIGKWERDLLFSNWFYKWAKPSLESIASRPTIKARVDSRPNPEMLWSAGLTLIRIGQVAPIGVCQATRMRSACALLHSGLTVQWPLVPIWPRHVVWLCSVLSIWSIAYWECNGSGGVIVEGRSLGTSFSHNDGTQCPGPKSLHSYKYPCEPNIHLLNQRFAWPSTGNVRWLE